MRQIHFAIILLLTLPVTALAAPKSSSKKTPPPPPEQGVDRYKVRRGETLWSIAREHGVSIGEIMDLNRMESSAIKEGQILKIPHADKDIALTPDRPTFHIVTKGETFRMIARANGVTQDELEHANPRVDPDKPKPGTKLTIPHIEPSAPPQSQPESRTPSSKDSRKPGTATCVVAENDTYYSIAKRYHTTVAALAAANPDVNPNRLRPGTRLNLPSPKQMSDRDDDRAPAKKTKSKSASTTGPARYA